MEQIKEEAMIPYLDCMTVPMMAKYYNVSPATVHNRYAYHKATFDKLGVMNISPKEFEELLPDDAKFIKSPERHIINYRFENGFALSLHTGWNQIFTKEAVEYMEEVIKPMPRGGARPHKKKENNIVAPAAKTAAPKFRDPEEKKLCFNLAKAYASGDTMKVLNAALALDTYRIETIDELQKTNADLMKNSDKRILWTERPSVSKIVKILTDILEKKQTDIWNSIYYKLTVNYHLPLESRNKLPLIEAVERSEWFLVYQAISELCDEKCLDMTRLFDKAGINTSGLERIVKEGQ